MIEAPQRIACGQMQGSSSGHAVVRPLPVQAKNVHQRQSGSISLGSVNIDWPTQLAEQLDWHWDNHLRPKLAGLADDEYFWEPVAGCWNVRSRSLGDTAAPGSGSYTVDFAWPEPNPAPVTTIAWRLAHITVGVFGIRAANHFNAPPVSYDDF